MEIRDILNKLENISESKNYVVEGWFSSKTEKGAEEINFNMFDDFKTLTNDFKHVKLKQKPDGNMDLNVTVDPQDKGKVARFFDELKLLKDTIQTERKNIQIVLDGLRRGQADEIAGRIPMTGLPRGGIWRAIRMTTAFNRASQRQKYTDIVNMVKEVDEGLKNLVRACDQIKNMVKADIMKKEELEETSDEAIARISEIYKDKK